MRMLCGQLCSFMYVKMACVPNWHHSGIQIYDHCSRTITNKRFNAYLAFLTVFFNDFKSEFDCADKYAVNGCNDENQVNMNSK